MTDDEQAKLWNGVTGQNWVESQDLLDGILRPFERLLVEQVSSRPGDRVLDVGCGAGATTLAIAELLDGGGSCTGVDISEPMIAAARARAERQGTAADFIRADAQTHGFDPASFDMIVSRFGVMFFDDPVQAFANLRRAAGGGGELRFIAWRDLAENPFMTAAERAAAPLLPNVPERRPDQPGPFALSDEGRVRRILDESGWAGIALEPIDVDCVLPEQELVPYFTRIGPLSRVLGETDEATRARVVETVRAAFEPYVHGTEVRFTAACWMVGATAPTASEQAPRRR